MGDFNINILNCYSDKDTTDFIDTMYASSLYPTIDTLTRITASHHQHSYKNYSNLKNSN